MYSNDVGQRRKVGDLGDRMRTQEAKALGPTLGEFYGQIQGLHRLRGLWPMASITETPTVIDSYSCWPRPPPSVTASSAPRGG